jgi:hypothetical protein
MGIPTPTVLQVRARNGYVAPLGRMQTPAIRGDARTPSVADAMSSPVALDAVPMRVAAASYRAGGRNASVVLTIELDASRLDLVERDGLRTGELELSYLATDASGRVRPGRRHSAELTMTATAAGSADAPWIRAVSEFELPHGRYQLRVAAGAGSRAGSVVYDLDVPDFGAGQLTLSQVSVTSGVARRLETLRLRDPLREVLPAPPVAVREFSADETLAVYAETYRNGRREGSDPDVVVALRRPDGSAVRTVRDHTTSAPLRGGQGGRGTMTYLPLSGLAPGAYVLHVEAHGGGSGEGVRRTVPVVIRAVS